MKWIFKKVEDYRKKKDWRKPYRKSKEFDKECRNHGSCPYCKSNRKHPKKADPQIEDFEE